MRRLLLGVVLGAGVVGCGGGGGGPDISGVYQTTLHEEAFDCGTYATVDDPDFFELALDSFGQFDYYAISYCTAADNATCDDGGSGLFGGLFLHDGDGWYTEAYASSQGGTSCLLSYSYVRATQVDGETPVLHIEREMHSLDVEGLTGDDCDPDAAKDRKDEMVCEGRERMEGNRVGDAGVNEPDDG